MISRGRKALFLVAVKEIWFAIAYKFHRASRFCAARVVTPFHNNHDCPETDSSCNGWQYYGEPSRPTDDIKTILLAASAMSLYVAAPGVVKAASFVGDKQSGLEVIWFFVGGLVIQ